MDYFLQRDAPMPRTRAALAVVSLCVALIVSLVVTSIISLLCRRQISRSRVARLFRFEASRSISTRTDFVSCGDHTEHPTMLTSYNFMPERLTRLLECVLRLQAQRANKDSSLFGDESAGSHLVQPSSETSPTWIDNMAVTVVSATAGSLATASGCLQRRASAAAMTSPIMASPFSLSASPTSPISIRRRMLANGFWHGQSTPRVSSPLRTSAVSMDLLAGMNASPEQARRGGSPTTPMTDEPLPGFARPGFRPSRPPVPSVLSKGLRLQVHGSSGHRVLSTRPQHSHAGPISTASTLSIVPAVIITPSVENRNDPTVSTGIHPFAPPALHAPVPSHGARPPAPVHPFSAGHSAIARGALSVHPALSLLRVRTSNSFESANLLNVTSSSSRVATTSLPAVRPAALSSPTGPLLDLSLVGSDNVQRVMVDQSAQGWCSPSFGPLPVCPPSPTSSQPIVAMLSPSTLPRPSGSAVRLSIQTEAGRGF